MSESSKIKKRISPDLLKVVNRVLTEYPELFAVRDEKEFEFFVADKDASSNFYFAVIKESSDSTGHYIEYTRRPASNSNKSSTRTKQKLPIFENNFKEWLNNLKLYAEPSAIDDSILKGYEDEFYEDFRIVDEDANERGFNYSQQHRLVKYLETISKDIEDLKDDKNSTLIEEIKSDATTLASEITTETKNGTIRRLTKMWAKARKGGLKVSDFMFKEFTKEFLKEGAKELFNFAIKNAHKIPEYVESLTRTHHG